MALSILKVFVKECYIYFSINTIIYRLANFRGMPRYSTAYRIRVLYYMMRRFCFSATQSVPLRRRIRLIRFLHFYVLFVGEFLSTKTRVERRVIDIQLQCSWGTACSRHIYLTHNVTRRTHKPLCARPKVDTHHWQHILRNHAQFMLYDSFCVISYSYFQSIK